MTAKHNEIANDSATYEIRISSHIKWDIYVPSGELHHASLQIRVAEEFSVYKSFVVTLLKHIFPEYPGKWCFELCGQLTDTARVHD